MGDSLPPSPAWNSVGPSRGKVGLCPGVTDCSVSREARVFPELIFTRPHWDSQQESRVEKEGSTKELSGAQRGP